MSCYVILTGQIQPILTRFPHIPIMSYPNLTPNTHLSNGFNIPQFINQPNVPHCTNLTSNHSQFESPQRVDLTQPSDHNDKQHTSCSDSESVNYFPDYEKPLRCRVCDKGFKRQGLVIHLF